MKVHFFHKDGGVAHAPRRPRALRVATGLFLAGIAALFMTGIGVVDHQSRAVGWDQYRQEFAVSISANTMRVTLFGASRSVSLRPLHRLQGYFARYAQGMDTIKPTPVWLAESAARRIIYAKGPRVEQAVRRLEAFAWKELVFIRKMKS